ncbi:MAG TPA: hypothetical protein VN579_04460 [Bryobacteraceae bacterium]|nr:hypothetical protein [Bryobacteraceae bacterium]
MTIKSEQTVAAENLRRQKAASTDPDRLEREAQREEKRMNDMETKECLLLSDWAARLGPESKEAALINYAVSVNPLLDDMLFKECNAKSAHEAPMRVTSAAPTGLRDTAGVARWDTGCIEGYSEVDKKLADQAGDQVKFRLSEDMAFWEGINQEMQRQVFYGDAIKNPADFMGLSSFFNSITEVRCGANIMDAGGTASANTSIWLAAWSPRTGYGLFPQGSKAGINFVDHGEREMPGKDGEKWAALLSWMQWKSGLCIPDWRYFVRIANVDITEAGLAGPTPPDLIGWMRKAIDQIPKRVDDMRVAFYINRTARHWLDVQAMKQELPIITLQSSDGNLVDTLDEIPIRIIDVLQNDEPRVV